MSRADVVTLIGELSMAQADIDLTVPQYLRDVMHNVIDRGLTAQVVIVETADGTAVYTPPSETVNVIAVFYDDRLLSYETHRTLEARDPQWRDARGNPIAWTNEGETGKRVRLYPKPTAASKTLIFSHAAPFGVDFPAYAIVAIINEFKEDVQQWYDVPLALSTLAREFRHESTYRDFEFARACDNLAGALMAMVV